MGEQQCPQAGPRRRGRRGPPKPHPPSIPSVSTLALPRYRDVMYIKTNGKATVGDNFPPPSHLVSRRLKQVYNNMLTTYRAIRELGSGNNAALQLPMLTR